MAAANLIPDDQTVYRGLRNANWRKGMIVNYRAFLLRPASERYPPEEELSLGLTAESAVDELREHFGTGALSVRAVRALMHDLRVLLDAENATKAEMHGLPMFSTDEAERDIALTVATDLASISWFVPVPQPN